MAKAAKPGIKTTEFWATVLGTILVAAGAEFGLELDPVATASVAAMVLGYVASRLFAKK